jgi:hypothetical protein
MKTFPTLTGTFIRWARTVHGESTQRCTLQPGFYSIIIIIYTKEYATSGGNIVFKADEPDTNCNADCTMWFLSYHGNNHYNSIWSPGNPPQHTQHITNVKRQQANLQSALDDYHNDYTQLVSSSIVANAPIPP